jgi:peptidoglycan/LPS O-acetylase OafA/YrhL
MQKEGVSNEKGGPKGYLPGLDGLRAVAIIAVMLAHFPYGMLPDVWCSGGPLGVEIFFALSGFLITRVLLGIKRDGVSFASFFVARFARIFPLYFAVCIASLFYYGLVDGVICTMNFAWVLTWPKEHVPVNTLVITWTLCVEEHFYCVWPFFVMWLSSRGAQAGAMVLIVLGVWWAWYAQWWCVETPFPPGLENRLVYLSTFSHIPTLCVGALIALNERLLYDRPRIVARMGVYALIAGWFLGPVMGRLFTSVAMWEFVRVYSSSLEGIGVFCLGLYLTYGNGFKPLRYVLEHPWLVAIGKISFCVYLIHLWVYVLATQFMPGHMRFAMTCGVFATLLLAKASYHGFEMPIRDAAKRFSGRFLANGKRAVAMAK